MERDCANLKDDVKLYPRQFENSKYFYVDTTLYHRATNYLDQNYSLSFRLSAIIQLRSHREFLSELDTDSTFCHNIGQYEKNLLFFLNLSAAN